MLSLPWATGKTWNLTGGPHGGQSETLDFAGGSGNVRAAREGVAYTPCGQGSDFMRIDHGGGLSTNYQHISSIAVTNGVSVVRGAYIGRIGVGVTCIGGRATGPHIHFWIKSGNTNVPISDIDLGGWTVSSLGSAYNGCMTQISDGNRQCARWSGNTLIEKGVIYNDGTIGSGVTPPPVIPKNSHFTGVECQLDLPTDVN